MSRFDSAVAFGIGRLQDLAGKTATRKLLGTGAGTSITGVWEPGRNMLEEVKDREGRLKEGVFTCEFSDYETVTFRQDTLTIDSVVYLVIDGVVDNAGVNELQCEEFTTTEIRQTPRRRF